MKDLTPGLATKRQESEFLIQIQASGMTIKILYSRTRKMRVVYDIQVYIKIYIK